MADRYEPNTVLIPSFLSFCKAELDFLVNEKGFEFMSGVSDWHGPSLNNISDTVIRPNIWYHSEVSFIKGGVEINVSLGEREWLLDVVIHYKDQGSFGLWEIIHEIDPFDTREFSGLWVCNRARAKKLLGVLGAVLNDYIDQIEAPTESVFLSIFERRKAEVEQTQANMKQDELDRAWHSVSQAFHDKDFKTVVTLLTPFIDILSPAQKLKLSYAKRKLNFLGR